MFYFFSNVYYNYDMNCTELNWKFSLFVINRASEIKGKDQEQHKLLSSETHKQDQDQSGVFQPVTGRVCSTRHRPYCLSSMLIIQLGQPLA